MCIFKKIFSKFKKKKEQEVSQEECWYNNSHEGGMAGAGSMEGGEATSANFLDFATITYIANK